MATSVILFVSAWIAVPVIRERRWLAQAAHGTFHERRPAIKSLYDQGTARSLGGLVRLIVDEDDVRLVQALIGATGAIVTRSQAARDELENAEASLEASDRETLRRKCQSAVVASLDVTLQDLGVGEATPKGSADVSDYQRMLARLSDVLDKVK